MSKLSEYVSGDVKIPGNIALEMVQLIDYFLRQMRAIGIPRWYNVGKMIEVYKLAVFVYAKCRDIFREK